MKHAIGELVEIVKYGHPFWFSKSEPYRLKWPVIHESEKVITYDTRPELVGQRGVIDTSHITQGMERYSIEGPNKHAWYSPNQLKLIRLSVTEREEIKKMLR